MRMRNILPPLRAIRCNMGLGVGPPGVLEFFPYYNSRYDPIAGPPLQPLGDSYYFEAKQGGPNLAAIAAPPPFKT